MEIIDIMEDEEAKLVRTTMKGRMISEQANKSFEKFVRDHIEKGFKSFLFNFSRLDFVNSSGIGSLIFMLKELNNAGAKCAVCSCQPNVYEIFVVTRLQRKMKVCKTEEEALEFLKN